MESIVVERNFLIVLKLVRQFVAKQYLTLMNMENVLVYVLIRAARNTVRLKTISKVI